MIQDNPHNVSPQEDDSKTNKVGSSPCKSVVLPHVLYGADDLYSNYYHSIPEALIGCYYSIPEPLIDCSIKYNQPPYSSETKDSLVRQLIQRRRLYLIESFSTVTDTVKNKAKENFICQLIQSFDQELLEDGYFHPSQEIIAQGLISSHDSVSQWLLEIYNDNLKANPSLSASLLKSIGRFSFAEVYPWGFMMACLGILENSVEIRGAAVDCFENWGNEQSLEKLKVHVNQEQVPWLRDYISQVIVDISSEQKEMELEISGS